MYHVTTFLWQSANAGTVELVDLTILYITKSSV